MDQPTSNWDRSWWVPARRVFQCKVKEEFKKWKAHQMVIMILDSGVSVSISSNGSILAVGGAADNDRVGATWIFVYNGTTYNQLGSKLFAKDSSDTSEQGKGGPSRCVVYHTLYDRR